MKRTVNLKEGNSAEVTIVDDDEPGDLAFALDMAETSCRESCGAFSVAVKRFDGCKGTISCKYRTVSQPIIYSLTHLLSD